MSHKQWSRWTIWLVAINLGLVASSIVYRHAFSQETQPAQEGDAQVSPTPSSPNVSGGSGEVTTPPSLTDAASKESPAQTSPQQELATLAPPDKTNKSKKTQSPDKEDSRNGIDSMVADEIAKYLKDDPLSVSQSPLLAPTEPLVPPKGSRQNNTPSKSKSLPKLGELEAVVHLSQAALILAEQAHQAHENGDAAEVQRLTRTVDVLKNQMRLLLLGK